MLGWLYIEAQYKQNKKKIRIKTATKSDGKQTDRQPTEISSNHAATLGIMQAVLFEAPRTSRVPRPIVFHERASCCCTPGFRNISRRNCYRLRSREKAARPRKRAQSRDSPRVYDARSAHPLWESNKSPTFLSFTCS